MVSNWTCARAARDQRGEAGAIVVEEALEFGQAVGDAGRAAAARRRRCQGGCRRSSSGSAGTRPGPWSAAAVREEDPWISRTAGPRRKALAQALSPWVSAAT